MDRDRVVLVFHSTPYYATKTDVCGVAMRIMSDTNNNEQSPVTGPIAGNSNSDVSNTDTLYLMQQYFDKTFHCLKRKISEEYDNKADCVAKKLKAETIQLKYPGNQKQFEFNLEVSSLVKSAERALNARDLEGVATSLRTHKIR